jgi:hypothetical protein
MGDRFPNSGDRLSSVLQKSTSIELIERQTQRIVITRIVVKKKSKNSKNFTAPINYDRNMKMKEL